MQSFLDDKVTLYGGDNREVLRGLADNSIDSIVTDPPYALVSIVERFGKEGAAPAKGEMYSGAFAGFMGKQWDTGEVAFDPEFWRECLRVLKPGGHMIAFSGTRTYHRLAVAIEDAGFEVRDQLAWLYGSGFPKSIDAAFAIEKTLCRREGEGEDARWVYKSDGAELVRGEWRHPAAAEWEGWQTALKPAWEPICLARKTIGKSTIVANLLKWCAGALNIDGCRVPTSETITATRNVALGSSSSGVYGAASVPGVYEQSEGGRYPANILHDGSPQILAMFPQSKSSGGQDTNGNAEALRMGRTSGQGANSGGLGDVGSAGRFFYSAKADAHDRIGSKHPTVKPVDLMQWCVRLVTPKGGVTLDPFAGTGTTGEAAFREGCRAVLIEREPEYQQDIARRMALALAGPDERKRESIKAKEGEKPFEAGSLFAGL
ncbi:MULTISPECIES: site-specific DNA-methyltransferase [unclassified Bradyrhizobium]|uniref:DNA-methyltransferase n=1 Tax=unclassified Bradyrhizobium TaxID=2631580 RepID=UPI0028E5F77F|nr:MULTISPECIES: site-specific DNA-methyltransferase [unclassified Bradyrhizobium]